MLYELMLYELIFLLLISNPPDSTIPSLKRCKCSKSSFVGSFIERGSIISCEYLFPVLDGRIIPSHSAWCRKGQRYCHVVVHSVSYIAFADRQASKSVGTMRRQFSQLLETGREMLHRHRDIKRNKCIF